MSSRTAPSTPAAAAAPATVEPSPLESGFLADYSRLRPSEQFDSVRFWRDDTRRDGYRRLHIRPVEVWRGADRRLEDVPEADLQFLADALYEALRQRLGASFELVDKPGDGVLDIHLGFTLVTDPDSKIDFFSTAVPVRDLPSRTGPLAADTKRFVRDCALEVEFREVHPNEKGSNGRPRSTVRAAFFDARRGAETPKGEVETWEDVKKVFTQWASTLDERLEALRDGSFQPKLTSK